MLAGTVVRLCLLVQVLKYGDEDVRRMVETAREEERAKVGSN